MCRCVHLWSRQAAEAFNLVPSNYRSELPRNPASVGLTAADCIPQVEQSGTLQPALLTLGLLLASAFVGLLVKS